jgi:pyruvate dehydrogenase E2 component (dihydrolipoamide acetyltransferase)
MATPIVLPKSMENGTLARWLKVEGDYIKSGDILAEVETDKALMELEATGEGVLVRILVPDGSKNVPVDTVVALLAQPAEGAKESAELNIPAAQTSAPTDAFRTVNEEATPASTKALAALPKLERGDRLFASPRARRSACKAGIELNSLEGSGPQGRIIERDVLQAKTAPPIDLKALFPSGTYTEMPHDGMRTVIARRLVEAKRTVPHFYLSVDCELDALLALRQDLNSAAATADRTEPFRLSVNDFLIKALAEALMKVPEANVSWTESALFRHRHADVSVAVAIPGGLITPIIRRAEDKTLATISGEMKALTARARMRKLRPEEYEGGTTTISNLGMFGVKRFSAIINPPQATILAVGAAERCVVVKHDQPAIAHVLPVSLSADHRAVDGAIAARLLREFKGLVGAPRDLLT